MARGEVATREPAELPNGWVITTSGRISGVTEPGELSVHYPFPIKDLVAIDDALKFGSRASKTRFAIYLGDLGTDTAARAREILADVPTRTTRCCWPSHPIRRSSRWSTVPRSGVAAPNRPRRWVSPRPPRRSSGAIWWTAWSARSAC